MQRLLERVWRDQGFTAILVTHDVSEAVALADRVLVIEDGRIAHDIDVDIPRPRRRGSAELAALEGSILRDLLQSAEEPIRPCEAAMNSAVRIIKLDREVSADDFRGAMRHLAGGVSVITVGRGRTLPA